MWRWFNQVGYSANVLQLRREFPGVPLKTFDEWVRDISGGRPQPAASV